jgi:glycosyltransferase involved in cell wall biosynthesis
MRIGIDARAIGGRLTGDRTYWRGLLSGLAEVDDTNEYVLFLRNTLSSVDLLNLPPNFSFRIIPSASERVWSMVDFGRGLRGERIELAHVQYTLPPLLPCPAVTTVHDISFHLFPQLFSPRDRWLLNSSIPNSIRRAKAVLTVSESSRHDILAAYPFLKPEKVVATPLAAGSAFRLLSPQQKSEARAMLLEKYGIDTPFILSLGVLQPRKNLPVLVKAFIDAKVSADLPHKLVIAGKVGWLSTETELVIGDGGDEVKLIGYVPDEDLPLLYGCADIMAYPSLYEGFGLPVLEAMASGCAVIASNNSSFPEVVGEAGILLPPDDIGLWSKSLTLLATNKDMQISLLTKGIRQAANFSWASTAKKILSVYRNAVTQ